MRQYKAVYLDDCGRRGEFRVRASDAHSAIVVAKKEVQYRMARMLIDLVDLDDNKKGRLK